MYVYEMPLKVQCTIAGYGNIASYHRMLEGNLVTHSTLCFLRNRTVSTESMSN